MVRTLLVGTDTGPVRALAAAIDADLALLPAAPSDEALEDWRAELGAGPPRPRVVVAPWRDVVAPGSVDDLDPASWEARAEGPLAAWVAALGVAVARCADGGTVVAVVERPTPLDCAGWAPESAVADAVEALVRSLGRSEGPRGVRVNAVTTPARFVTGEVVAPPPPLASFPGTVEVEVAGAVRLLLDDAAGGLTCAVVHADQGRSWR